MAKQKGKIFKVKKDETVVYEGKANYCFTGHYAHAIMGDAMLTDKRFLFKSDLTLTREDKYLEIPIEEIDFVSKTGIPLLTSSLYISCSSHTGKNYRVIVYHMKKWLNAFQKVLSK